MGTAYLCHAKVFHNNLVNFQIARSTLFQNGMSLKGVGSFICHCHQDGDHHGRRGVENADANRNVSDWNKRQDLCPQGRALSCPERFLKPGVPLDHLNLIVLPKSDNKASDPVNTHRNSLFQSWTAKSEKRA